MVERVLANLLERDGARRWKRLGWRGPRWEPLSVMTAASAIDLFAWEFVRRHQLALGSALAVQVGLALLLALWLVSRRRRGAGTPLDALFSAFIAFLGPLGVVCVLATALFLGLYRRHATSFDDWYAALFPKLSDTLSGGIYQQIGSRRERSAGSADVRPFIDLLTHGTSEQKQAVVTLLARKYDPALSGALDRALNDGDPSIRILAASASAAIEQRYVDRWLELAAGVEDTPGDYRAHFALASHLDDYAFSGILGSQRAEDVRAQALQAYRQCLRLDEDSREARFAMGRLLLRADKVSEACDVFREILDGTESPADAGTVGARGFHAECLYRLGRFGELRTALSGFFADGADESDLPEPLADVARLWRDHDIDEVAKKA